MFPHPKRLPRATLPRALSAGRRFSSTHFTAVADKNAIGYAVIVSKKVARLSVTRHRIKRRVFEALRTLALPPSLILFPTRAAHNLTFAELRTELATLLSKIR